ncbi:MAG TPA: NAD-dependent epimerase [bacterium]|nr:NAD-dependent epimerase [bacterium]
MAGDPSGKIVPQRVLLTGAAGFIGSHLARKLLDAGAEVFGFDNVNDYYDVRLKEARLARLLPDSKFRFTRADLADRAALERAFADARPDVVVNLAAQVGVRYSRTNPGSYVQSNLVGFVNLLECCRAQPPKHLVFASSSSVYGANTKAPSSENDSVDHPLNLYAASKKANELLAHSYAHLYAIPSTGLRFFTVYGPWGRPDMALFLFTEAITEGRPIDLFGDGLLKRDFTYVDDIVGGVMRVMERPAKPDPAWSGADPDPATSAAPWRVYNIGHSEPVEVRHVVALLEKALGKKAITVNKPRDPADVPATCADVSALERDVGFRPTTAIEDGVPRFVEWYRQWRATRDTVAAQPASRR